MNEEEMNAIMTELEELRAEKRSREQTQRAAAALESAGAPQEFAALLIGSDNEDTDRRVQAFCTVYQANLSRDIKKRLPAEPPLVSDPAPKRSERGIRVLQ